MAQHEHGSMNIKDQEKTFDGFVTWSIRVAIACIGVLLFLAVFAS
ncbi:MAG: aa3-type cytochrome c oxidase subunit IV [Pseudomonadota bacterium]